MARSELQDPLDKYRWTVDIDGFSRFGFTSCQTPSYSITTHKYKEGGAHLQPRNIVNDIEYRPVTLTRGVTNDTSFNKWATGFYDLVTDGVGAKSDNLLKSFGNALGVGGSDVKTFNPGKQYRRNVTIRHVNRVGITVVTYTLFNAFPIEYKPASDFNADDDEGFSIESITLEYETFSVQYSGIAGALASIATSI